MLWQWNVGELLSGTVSTPQNRKNGANVCQQMTRIVQLHGDSTVHPGHHFPGPELHSPPPLPLKILDLPLCQGVGFLKFHEIPPPLPPQPFYCPFKKFMK